ncbi:undecaprenyl-diphosphatase [Paenibacillus pinistramenti]|uniref:undecaprenyl-diphosphatase n=1 Tax=Paenibacillus pinistramenti TaxID=1768003 RepID=UPI001108CFAE|nr:undecaprenyl-diphosphatase [Paenibacillus pinistramenti]
MMNFDYRMFEWINNLAGHYPFWDNLMTFLAKDGEYVFFIGVIFYWFVRSARSRQMVVELLIAACAALGIASVIGRLDYRDRPFVQHHVHQLIAHAANASFPSDHATAAFAVAAAIWCSKRREGWLWLLLASGIAVSRIWTGVHYPLDVISGALLGILCAIASHFLFSKLPFIQSAVSRGINQYERLEHKVGHIWR